MPVDQSSFNVTEVTSSKLLDIIHSVTKQLTSPAIESQAVDVIIIDAGIVGLTSVDCLHQLSNIEQK
jgi:two-component SAPR family response regulator